MYVTIHPHSLLPANALGGRMLAYYDQGSVFNPPMLQNKQANKESFKK